MASFVASQPPYYLYRKLALTTFVSMEEEEDNTKATRYQQILLKESQKLRCIMQFMDVDTGKKILVCLGV